MKIKAESILFAHFFSDFLVINRNRLIGANVIFTFLK